MAPIKSGLEPGAIVWAKCGNLFWPAEIVDFDKLPEEIREDFDDDKKPQYVVKFFDEDGYEFLKNDKNLHPYNCEKKEDFIKKGIVKSRTKSKESGATGSWFAKFPQDVVRCEKLTGGDEKILEKEPFIEKSERINYKDYFGDPAEKQKSAKTPASKRKGTSSPVSGSTPKKKAKEDKNTPSRPISHPRFKPGGEQHQVRIMQQPSTPYHLDLQKKEESKAASQGNYTCQKCPFSASRLNVIILHNKTCSASAKSPSAKGASPSTPASARGRKRGSSSAASSPARSKPSTPVEKKSTPKAANGRGRGGGARGGGRGAASAGRSPAIKAESAAKSTASSTKEKKPRMTKKKKDELAKEQEKKIEERKKILGEWDDEEDGEAEAEEKKKIKESLKDKDQGSDQSEAESDQEAYFQDDNVHMDDEDDEIFQDGDKKTENNEDAKTEETDEKPEAADEKSEVDTKESAHEEEAEVTDEKPDKVSEDDKESKDAEKLEDDKKSGEKVKDNESLVAEADKTLENVAKLLEETKVPDLPDTDIDLKKSSPTSKKSVKFSPQVAKEFAITKMALVQPKTNMTGPMLVDDEFEDAAEQLDYSPPKSTKTILKRAKSPPPLQISEEKMEVEEKSAESSAETTADNQSADAPTAIESVKSSATTEAAATMLELGQLIQAPNQNVDGSSTDVNKDATYLLVVDESNQLDQLNSQTFYIDSNSLANGDLSNMVLTTEQPPGNASNGHHDQVSNLGPANNAEAVQTSTTTSSNSAA